MCDVTDCGTFVLLLKTFAHFVGGWLGRLVLDLGEVVGTLDRRSGDA